MRDGSSSQTPIGRAPAETVIFDRMSLAAALDRNGGDLSRWPAALRAEAEALAARDPAARGELDRALRLEDLIGAVARPQPIDAATIGRVMSGLQGRAQTSRKALACRRARERVWRATPRFALASVAGLALCTMVGLGLGYVAPVPAETGTSVATNASNQDIATALLGFDPGESL